MPRTTLSTLASIFRLYVVSCVLWRSLKTDPMDEAVDERKELGIQYLYVLALPLGRYIVFLKGCLQSLTVLAVILLYCIMFLK